MKEFSGPFLERFLSTAMDRHNIYIKKEEFNLPSPWSRDPVFQRYFFCNLFRQLDKCTKWIKEKIVPFERWDLILLYRFISTYDLFLEVEGRVPLDSLSQMQGYLGSKHERGEKLFSSCFIRNPRIPGGWVETYKAPFVLIEELRKNTCELYSEFEHGTLESMVKFLKRFPGVGGFMAYEYACDFEYTRFFNPKDKMTWANMGPGAKKGMSLLLTENPDTNMSQATWLEHALILRDVLTKRFNRHFPDSRLQITMREVEHWLCEFQKYCKYLRMNKGEGRVKHRKYDGGFK